MSTIYLKVKIKSLAEEARIIRKEEGKAKLQRRYWMRTSPEEVTSEASSLFWGLRIHRTSDVRDEARATQLAYAYLRGRSYYSTEGLRRQLPNYILVRAAKMIMKYGPRDQVSVTADLKAWTEATPLPARCSDGSLPKAA